MDPATLSDKLLTGGFAAAIAVAEFWIIVHLYRDRLKQSAERAAELEERRKEELAREQAHAKALIDLRDAFIVKAENYAQHMRQSADSTSAALATVAQSYRKARQS